ncbi:vacuolar import and degradation protein [Xylariales sp. AK1849]|nr:vacuolar import and degradation protein [Xylariales sp. AK1849]
MPTPSSNPPPELPPRSHSSSCPDELRASTSSWRPDQAEGIEEMHVDSDSASTPEAVSAPPRAESETRMAEDVDVDSRSNTESPRPDSRGGDTETATRETTQDIDDIDDGPPTQSSKPMDTDTEHSGTRAGSSMEEGVVGRTADSDRGSAAFDMISPAGADCDKPEREDAGVSGNSRVQDEYSVPSMGYEFSNIRIIPTTTSSYLRPGTKFHGTQQSERQIYDVQVEIKYVDLRESFMCGYLKIQGLTEDNPTLTTYFEGEIIGSRYSFITNHPSWGATEKIDISHWNKFSAFRPYAKQARKSLSSSSSSASSSSSSSFGQIPNLGNKDNIFMRWKEHFLVPDHRVRTINGASFEGFYYICFNQKEGTVSGIYFHAKSEKFQQLELKHVEDRGCLGAMEFR